MPTPSKNILKSYIGESKKHKKSSYNINLIYHILI